MTAFTPWSFREDLGESVSGLDLTGYKVEAVDAKIGKVDESTGEVGDRYLMVDTGPWIFGKKVLLPAGTINNIDPDDKTIYIDRTKEQIKDSPEFRADGDDVAYREQVGKYYEGTYSG